MNNNVTVIGGGPAGSSTAIFLARNGFDVTLYEKNTKQRKPCAGGLRHKVVNKFGEFLEGIEKYPVNIISIDFNGSKFDTDFGEPFGCTIDRKVFDANLRSIAKSDGVKIVNKKIDKFPDGIVIDATGFKKPENASIAIRAFAKVKKPMNILFQFETNSLGPGYFWIFPMNENQVNLGVCGFVKHFKGNPLSLLNKFSANAGLKMFDIKSGTLNMDGNIGKLVNGNVIKVGEAAGIVNPITGEGIYHALESGRILAECLSKDKLSKYERRIKSKFGFEFGLSKVVTRCIMSKNFPNIHAMKTVMVCSNYLWHLKK